MVTMEGRKCCIQCLIMQIRNQNFSIKLSFSLFTNQLGFSELITWGEQVPLRFHARKSDSGWTEMLKEKKLLVCPTVTFDVLFIQRQIYPVSSLTKFIYIEGL